MCILFWPRIYDVSGLASIFLNDLISSASIFLLVKPILATQPFPSHLLFDLPSSCNLVVVLAFITQLHLVVVTTIVGWKHLN